MDDGYELKGALVGFRMMYWMSSFEVVAEWEF